MAKHIYLDKYNISYHEGDNPVYFQVYLNKSDTFRIDIGLVVAKDDEDALKQGEELGNVLLNIRLFTLFSRLSMLLHVDNLLDKH